MNVKGAGTCALPAHVANRETLSDMRSAVFETVVRTESAGVSELLYKVARPRDDWTFVPNTFWRSGDWSSSSRRRQEGYLEECVLYAARFDEVNIHLLPKVWRARVWLDDEERDARLRRLGFSWEPGSRAVIFALASDRQSIESFAPTVFVFQPTGFHPTQSNEFVSREPRAAISAETMSFAEAVRRWRFALMYVENAAALEQTLRESEIDHQIQT